MTSLQSSNGNAMACHHHRSAAIVCNDGMTTFYASYPPIPADILALIEQGRDEEANPLLATMIKDDTNARWGLTNGVWANGVANFADQWLVKQGCAERRGGHLAGADQRLVSCAVRQSCRPP
ncbi:MAG: hypothetical protein QOI01_3241 [Mycobacterium sp.]|jgi:hypothetical protein|nr:hypothetical protein [Mycobacterium sp.]